MSKLIIEYDLKAMHINGKKIPLPEKAKKRLADEYKKLKERRANLLFYGVESR